MRRFKSILDWPSPTTKRDEQRHHRDSVILTLKKSNKNVFDVYKKGSFYCWVEPILTARQKWQFEFNLFIDNNENTFKQTFIASYKQIEQVINISKVDSDWFATRKFPIGISHNLCTYL